MSTFYSKINEDLKNIWRYAVFYPPIKKENQLTFGEGNTPEIQSFDLTKKMGFEKLIFKREDYNPNGSHKDRALCYQVSRAKENGEKALVISSSGNAAVSAAAYCQLAGIRLFVFVSPKTDNEKMARVANFGSTVIISRHALTLADLAAKKFKIKNLKPSANESSYYGLKSIAFEIYEHWNQIDAIFIPTSSASTLLGIGEAFDELAKSAETRKLPALYAVQTAKIHPVAEYFDRNFVAETESLARGIISRDIEKEKLARILRAIKSSNGGGAIVSNHDILATQSLLAGAGIITGYESAASFAGAVKLKDKLKGKKVIVLLTGRKSEAAGGEAQSDNIYKAENIDEVEKIFQTKN